MTNQIQISSVKLVIFSGVVLGLGLALFVFTRQPREDEVWTPSGEQLAQVTAVEERRFREITLGDRRLRVEVVETIEKIVTGLSYREEIGSDGMLFVMPRKHVPTFWMKGMRFGLDMLWINCLDPGSEPGSEMVCEVVDVTKYVPAPENPDDLESLDYYSPRFEVTHVLEVPAGWVDENGVELGNEAVVVKSGM